MRTIKLFVFVIALFLAGSTQAQLSVHFNIGAPPMWGPAGYEQARYYYLPDVEAYYDVQSSMFIYYEGRNWVHRSYLPGRYKNYDLYGGYKVVMKDYRGNTPYSNFNEYKKKYARGSNRQMQKTIGERPGKGNFNKKDNRENNQVNRGRNENLKNDKRGNDKNNKNDRERGDDNGNRK